MVQGRRKAGARLPMNPVLRPMPMQERQLHQSMLSLMLGPSSCLDFLVRSVDGQPGDVHSLLDIDHGLYLSEVTTDSPVRIRLMSSPLGAHDRFARTDAFFPFSEVTCTLVRFGFLDLGSRQSPQGLFSLDTSLFKDSCGREVPSQDLALVLVRGHGYSGSIQLVTSRLASRLPRFYPGMYQVLTQDVL